jgi:uncharacterized protein YdeI (YjbR/CyaY-like superfamily)
MEPIFFRSAAEFRAWLERHHDTSTEILVGYHKKGTGKLGMGWDESVDQALCFGWIDGVRRGIDDERYMNRFTPRQRGSTWSAKNINRAKELIDQGLITPAGLEAFEARVEDRSPYAYERRHTVRLDATFERRFRRNAKAWEIFLSKPPSYRQAAIRWVMSAKKQETRERRLARLIDVSAAGRTVPPVGPGRAASPRRSR